MMKIKVSVEQPVEVRYVNAENKEVQYTHIDELHAEFSDFEMLGVFVNAVLCGCKNASININIDQEDK